MAMIYPEPAKLKRGGSSNLELPKGRLSEARTIVKASTDLAERGGKSSKLEGLQEGRAQRLLHHRCRQVRRPAET